MKYEITDIACEDNPKLFRIRALANIPAIGVKAGTLGGCVEGEHNLSQEGDCWVSANARVYGNAQVYRNSRVYGNARVYGYATVFGNAQVFENASLSENSRVSDSARVFGRVHVCGNAWVSGNAQVSGSFIVTANVHKNMQIDIMWDEDAYVEWFFTHKRQAA